MTDKFIIYRETAAKYLCVKYNEEIYVLASCWRKKRKHETFDHDGEIIDLSFVGDPENLTKEEEDTIDMLWGGTEIPGIIKDFSGVIKRTDFSSYKEDMI